MMGEVIRRRKIGRPRKSPQEKRSQRIVLTLIPEERERFEQYADNESVSLSRALREAFDTLYKVSLGLENEQRSGIGEIMFLAQEIVSGKAKERFDIPVELRGTVRRVDGELIFSGTARELPKEAKLKKKLQELSEKYNNLLANPPTGEFVFQDDRFRVINTNLVDMCGFNKERLLTQSVFGLVHPDDRQMIEKRARGRVSGGVAPSQYMFRALREDGETIHLAVSAAPIEYEGKPAIIGHFVNLTPYKKLEQSLRTLEELIG